MTKALKKLDEPEWYVEWEYVQNEQIQKGIILVSAPSHSVAHSRAAAKLKKRSDYLDWHITSISTV